VTCHTLPTGAGTDHRNIGGTFQPIAPGPDGERHLLLVSNDPTTAPVMKVSQLRNQYEKTGFYLSQNLSTRGFGYLHDGSFDTLERFLSDLRFSTTSDQMVANLTAFMLAFSGSELPQGSTVASAMEPPGPPSDDTHAAVGRQLTLSAAADRARDVALELDDRARRREQGGLDREGHPRRDCARIQVRRRRDVAERSSRRDVHDGAAHRRCERRRGDDVHRRAEGNRNAPGHRPRSRRMVRP
jgi:hypothetical protein